MKTRMKTRRLLRSITANSLLEAKKNRDSQSTKDYRTYRLRFYASDSEDGDGDDDEDEDEAAAAFN